MVVQMSVIVEALGRRRRRHHHRRPIHLQRLVPLQSSQMRRRRQLRGSRQ
jgi:hypothetical protein